MLCFDTKAARCSARALGKVLTQVTTLLPNADFNHIGTSGPCWPRKDRWELKRIVEVWRQDLSLETT